MSGSLNRLIALLKEHTSVSRTSYHFKPWWTPHLTVLRREYPKAARTARKDDTPHMREVAGTSKVGYFKAINVQNVNARGTIYSMWIILRNCEGSCEARVVRSREQIW